MKKKEYKFPRISRRITDKKVWSVVASVVIGLSILIVGADLQKSIQNKQRVEKERMRIVEEIKYWEKTIEKYKDFRDGYFQLAVLNYQLGNSGKAKGYLRRVFELDPNFKKGRDLEKLL